MQTALVRPILGLGDQLGANRILFHVGKLAAIMPLGAHLGVPAIPFEQPGQGWKFIGGQSFPIFAPDINAGGIPGSGAAEEMDVIRHHHIIANQPVRSAFPYPSQGSMDIGGG